MFEYVRVCFDFDSFEWWGGARDRMNDATEEQKQAVKERLESVFECEEIYPTETEVNDFVWFECDDIFNEEND